MEDRDGENGLCVNMGKTKIMESSINLDVLKKSGEYPCGVCLTGVGSTNAILCDGCEHWVHKKCSGIKGRLLPDRAAYRSNFSIRYVYRYKMIDIRYII